MSNLREIERTVFLVNPCAPFRPTIAGKSWGVPTGLGVVGSMADHIVKREGFGKEVEIRVVDENLGQVCDPKPGDLVLASSLSLTSKRVKALTREAISKRASMVAGGIHATQVPNDFAEEGAVSFRGEAGNSIKFNNLIRQWLHEGELDRGMILDSEGVTNPKAIDLSGLPVSEEVYKQLDKNRYALGTFAIVGCPYDCGFCAKMDGSIVRTRPVEDVTGEIRLRRLDKHGFIFTDSNLAAAPDNYLYGLLEALAPLKIPNGWASELSINLLDRGGDELLDALKAAHCQNLYVGFESPSAENLEKVGKKQNLEYVDSDKVKEIVEKAHRRGIKITGLFIVGFLTDTINSIRDIEYFIKDSKLDEVLISILTPLPGSKIWEQFIRDGLFDPQTLDTDELDLRHLLFKHSLGNDVLLREYERLCGRVFALPRVLFRSTRALRNSLKANVPESLRGKIQTSVGVGLVEADLYRGGKVLHGIQGIYNIGSKIVGKKD